MKRILILALLTTPAQAQNFTTQAEVQPILEITRAHWVGIGTATGRDLLYFTHLLSWRCGVAEIRYGLNGAAPETLLQMEPCHRETNQPNAIRELPFIGFALDEIAAVSVRVVFPDGAEMVQEFTRPEIRID